MRVHGACCVLWISTLRVWAKAQLRSEDFACLKHADSAIPHQTLALLSFHSISTSLMLHTSAISSVPSQRLPMTLIVSSSEDLWRVSLQ